MKNLNHEERTLAYKKALVIKNDELQEINGGSMAIAASYTTKQSVDSHGNWDVGGDILW